MDLSGVIFVVLALAWALYLVPKALKHHDEVARTRSVDRFSRAMRVLARREAVDRRGSRLVVTPARPAGATRVVGPPPRTARPEAPAAPAPAVAAAAPADSAARAAARRRRRILGLLLAATVVVTVLAGLAVVPWWSVAVPVAVSVLFLVVCRRQVRRGRISRSLRASSPAPAPEQAARVARPAARVATPYGSLPVPVDDEGGSGTTGSAETGPAEVGSAAQAVDVPVVSPDRTAATAPDAGSLWDPLPVTLPTYVTKPRARRTVRTIELGEPGTWTSGHTAEDSRLAAEAVAVPAVDEAESTSVATQQAVGH